MHAILNQDINIDYLKETIKRGTMMILINYLIKIL